MLKPKQIKCIKLMITGDLSDKQIAEVINVTQKTICEWKKNPEFQKEYDSVIRGSLQYASAKAFAKQLRLLNSKNDMVAHLASKDIMDRAGLSPATKIEGSLTLPVVIKDDIPDED